MGLILVEGMPLQPHNCVCCGKGPRDENGDIRENVFAEAIDINWGDSVYICPECGIVIGGLYGMLREDEFEELTNRLEELEGIEEKYDQLNERVRRILEGNKARKEVSKNGSA